MEAEKKLDEVEFGWIKTSTYLQANEGKGTLYTRYDPLNYIGQVTLVIYASRLLLGFT